MANVTLSATYATYQGSSGWWAQNNTWNEGNLVDGVNYTETITLNPTTFPQGTVLSWNYGNNVNSADVWAYPEVVYGAQVQVGSQAPSNGVTPVQIQNLTALTGSFNLTLGGSTGDYDVLWETFLTSAPDNGPVAEFGIFLHAPSYITNYANTLPQQYSYNADGFSATIAVDDDSGTTVNGKPLPYIEVIPTGGQLLSGTVNLQALLNFLVSKGVISGSDYIDGFELGSEMQQGSGSVTINSLGYDWNGNLVGSDAGTGGADVITPTAEKLSTTAGQAFSGTVATFTDSNTSIAASGLTATINWGDGTTATAGVVTGSDGSFTVTGTHTYSAAGSDTVAVTLTEASPGTASATADSTMAVSASSTTITLTASNTDVTENVSNDVITGAVNHDMVFIGGTGNTITLTGGNNTVTADAGKNTITTGGGSNTIDIAGSGNVVNAGAGNNTIHDTGSDNTIILPAAGKGDDAIYGKVMTNGDTFNLTGLLAATSWNGMASDIGNFIHVATRNNNAVITVTPTGSASGGSHRVATLEGSGAVSLTTLLAHAIT